MVTVFVESIYAGIIVSVINKYILSGWLRESIQSYWCVEEYREEEDHISSTNTSISNASIHMHSHA
jgi:hypothetical protein